MFQYSIDSANISMFNQFTIIATQYAINCSHPYVVLLLDMVSYTFVTQLVMYTSHDL